MVDLIFKGGLSHSQGGETEVDSLAENSGWNGEETFLCKRMLRILSHQHGEGTGKKFLLGLRINNCASSNGLACDCLMVSASHVIYCIRN